VEDFNTIIQLMEPVLWLLDQLHFLGLSVFTFTLLFSD